MSTGQLSLRTASLARAAPGEWKDFLAEFRNYVGLCRDDLVKAPLEVLPKMQGRAQQMDALVSLFESAVKTADRISERRG